MKNKKNLCKYNLQQIHYKTGKYTKIMKIMYFRVQEIRFAEWSKQFYLKIIKTCIFMIYVNFSYF